MKKNLRFIWLSVVGLSRCVSYQYNTMSSHLPADETGSYTFENDSIRVSYSFKASSGMKVRITNKLESPIDIHWNRSSIVINDESHAFLPGVNNFNGTAESVGVQWTQTVSSSSTIIDGQLETQQVHTMIPPKAFIVNSSFDYLNVVSVNDSKVQTRLEKKVIQGDVYRFHSKEFEATDSPLKIRSFISYSPAQTPDKLSFIENTFWLSKTSKAFLNRSIIVTIYRRTTNL